VVGVNEQPTIHAGWGAPKGAPAPLDVREAVELWARANRGTHGTIAWNPLMNCWQVNFDLKDDDPRMKSWRDGKLKVKPSEPVYLHRQKKNKDGTPTPYWEAVPLEELGVSGVLRWLDEGNCWSGTGRYASFDAACKAADDHNEMLRAKIAKEAEINAGLRARDERKRLLKTPWTTVPAQLEK
jgi:hypothetical protein